MRTIGTWKAIVGLLALSVGMSSCDDWFDGKDEGDEDIFDTETYAADLDTPWEMDFAADGRLFITQRAGMVTVVDNGTTKTWLALDSVVQEIGESGLTGIVLHPEFAQNGYVYVAYTYAMSKSPLKLVNTIVRYKENASKAPQWDKVILDGVESNYLHTVGSLEFGPDGMLYATIGDNFKPEWAQDLSVLNGKILRMTADGGAPADNPIAGSLIYSYGHRNPQGIAFHPDTKALWETEHGPSVEQGCCMDEINMIKPGANYGWPLIRGSQQQAGLETSVYHSGDTTTWAPTSGTFLTQGEWKGSFLFTGLRGQALYRAVFDPADANKITKVERYLHETFGRLRNVVEGPDGRIFISVSNQDGRGNADFDKDRVIVLTQDRIRRAGNGEQTPAAP
jgi:glucose/arabinose dehydrogenase